MCPGTVGTGGLGRLALTALVAICSACTVSHTAHVSIDWRIGRFAIVLGRLVGRIVWTCAFASWSRRREHCGRVETGHRWGEPLVDAARGRGSLRGEIAASVILFVGAAVLLVAEFVKLQHVDSGLSPTHVLTFR